jgi:hypothetical protein
MNRKAAQFMYLWIQDNIAARAVAFRKWDNDLIKDMARMCIAEAKANGVSVGDLEETVEGDLDTFIACAIERAKNEELAWRGESGMESQAVH